MLNNNGGLKKGGLLFEIFWLCSPSTLLSVLCLSLSLYRCPLQVLFYPQQFLHRVGPFPRRASSLVSLRGQSGRTAWTLLNFTMDPCVHLILAHWPTILSSEACWLLGFSCSQEHQNFVSLCVLLHGILITAGLVCVLYHGDCLPTSFVRNVIHWCLLSSCSIFMGKVEKLCCQLPFMQNFILFRIHVETIQWSVVEK